jgi:hypothetical protein
VSLYPRSVAKRGAIAGTALGGVVGLVLLGTLLFLLLRRRNTPSPSPPPMASQNPASPSASPYPSNPASPGPYAPTPVPGSLPMFPSNYPNPGLTSVGGMQQPYYTNQVPITNYTGANATIGGHSRSQYSGMPEV